MAARRAIAISICTAVWAFSALGFAPARADGTAAPDTLKSDTPAGENRVARPSGHSRHRSAQQAVDEAVRRMTLALDLDPGQQERLRSLIVEEQRDLRKISTEGTQPDQDRAGQMKAVVDRTRGQIRSMLTDEQRKKYPGVTPSGLLGPAHTDLDHWLGVTQGNPGSVNGNAAPQRPPL